MTIFPSTTRSARRFRCAIAGSARASRRPTPTGGTSWPARHTARRPRRVWRQLPTVPPPPNGTIFDRLEAHNISWKNYASDLAQLAIIPQAFIKYADPHVSPIAQYYKDAAAGTLPSRVVRRPEVRQPGDERGEPARHPPRRRLLRQGHQGGDDREGVEEHVAHLDLRRARRLLRPRRTAQGGQARRHPARHPDAARRGRRLRPATASGSRPSSCRRTRRRTTCRT